MRIDVIDASTQRGAHIYLYPIAVSAFAWDGLEDCAVIQSNVLDGQFSVLCSYAVSSDSFEDMSVFVY